MLRSTGLGDCRSRISLAPKKKDRGSQQPTHFREGKHVTVRKTARGEGIRCAHLLMVDAMATTTPRAILLRANGVSGAAAAPWDTEDALNAMAITRRSPAGQRSRRGGRDLRRSCSCPLPCACCAALALQQEGFLSTLWSAIKKGLLVQGSFPPRTSFFYFILLSLFHLIHVFQ